MALLGELKDGKQYSVFYYSSAIGALFVFVIILATFIHTLKHFIKAFCCKKKDYVHNSKSQNKMIYILFFVISIIALIICLLYAFTRSNLFTREKLEDYTEIQCALAHWSGYSLIAIEYTIVYALFLYRIQVVFNSTTYEYPNIVYIALYVGLGIGCSLCLLFLYISVPDTDFVIWYFDDDKKYLYCDSAGDRTGFDDERSIFNALGILVFILTQIIYNITLLYMFSKRLYALQTELVKQYMDEKRESCTTTGTSSSGHRVEFKTIEVPQLSPKTPTSMNNESQDIADLKGYPSTSNIQASTSMPDDMERRIKRTMSIGDMVDQAKKSNQAAKRIVNLLKMIKKFTILVWIQILTASIFTILMYIEDWIWLQLIWLLLVNNICIWLMFHFAYPYYKFTTKWCCCYFCYRNKDKDITAKTCCCFC